jgi:predicted Zn-dependent peptidase
MAEFYKKKLDNGMTVLFEKRNLPVISISATAKIGAEYETEENKGISHFIEHLMFKGTKTRKQEEIAREVEKKGGVLNAYTDEEETSYWCKLPSKHLNSGGETVSDLILNPKFDKVEFEKEKQVIIEEIKMYKDNPMNYVMDKIKEMLYEKPFGMSIAGEAEIIRGLSREKTIDFYNKHYPVNRMILTAVGKAEFDDILEIAKRLYPSARQGEVKESFPIRKNDEKMEKRKGIDQAHFVFGFHTPKANEREIHDYEVAGAYLFEGMSSRLFQEIREKRGLAYAIKGSLSARKNFGYGVIYAGAAKEKIEEIKKIIVQEIKNLKKLEQKELSEIKEQLIGLHELASEDSTNVMSALAATEVTDEAEEYYKYEERINAVKLEDVRNVSKLKKYSTFSLVPE